MANAEHAFQSITWILNWMTVRSVHFLARMLWSMNILDSVRLLECHGRCSVKIPIKTGSAKYF